MERIENDAIYKHIHHTELAGVYLTNLGESILDTGLLMHTRQLNKIKVGKVMLRHNNLI